MFFRLRSFGGQKGHHAKGLTGNSAYIRTAARRFVWANFRYFGCKRCGGGISEVEVCRRGAASTSYFRVKRLGEGV